MKFCLVLLVSLSAVSAQGLFGAFVPRLPSQPAEPLFDTPLVNTFRDIGGIVASNGIQFATAAERSLRESIFKTHEILINAHNAAFYLGKSSFKMGVNIFAELSKTEFLARLTGLRRSRTGDSLVQVHRSPNFDSTFPVYLPDSFDWRQVGGVTPVKFQGYNCSSCWSFAVTGAVEGHYFRKTNQLITLSEQNLIDCSSHFGNAGCDGGYQEYGFAYIMRNNGIAKSEFYPYKMMNDFCSYGPHIKAVDVKGFAKIAPGNERKMKEVVANLGPLACSMNAGADSFQFYTEGIYADEECNSGEVNHSVLVVGYGSENEQDYWIVKNSWSSDWGEKGFVRIPRNRNNFCGIATECSYPIL